MRWERNGHATNHDEDAAITKALHRPPGQESRSARRELIPSPDADPLRPSLAEPNEVTPSTPVPDGILTVERPAADALLLRTCFALQSHDNLMFVTKTSSRPSSPGPEDPSTPGHPRTAKHLHPQVSRRRKG